MKESAWLAACGLRTGRVGYVNVRVIGRDLDRIVVVHMGTQLVYLGDDLRRGALRSAPLVAVVLLGTERRERCGNHRNHHDHKLQRLLILGPERVGVHRDEIPDHDRDARSRDRQQHRKDVQKQRPVVVPIYPAAHSSPLPCLFTPIHKSRWWMRRARSLAIVDGIQSSCCERKPAPPFTPECATHAFRQLLLRVTVTHYPHQLDAPRSIARQHHVQLPRLPNPALLHR